MSFCTMFFLVGICFCMSSCSPSLEKRIEKYEKEGKTILSSTVGQETKNHCILFADDKGVSIDNLNETFQIIAFNKEYPSVNLGLAFSGNDSKITIERIYL